MRFNDAKELLESCGYLIEKIDPSRPSYMTREGVVANRPDDDKDLTEQLRGTIIFLKSNVGSKSEGVFPCLYINKEKMIKVYVKDDNPFENESFKKYDGKKVLLIGKFGRNNTFMVEEINKI